MLEQPMIEKLVSMRLQGMADALKAQEQDVGIRELSFVELLAQSRCQRRYAPMVFGLIAECRSDSIRNAFQLRRNPQPARWNLLPLT
jgi:hypothetical protein